MKKEELEEINARLNEIEIEKYKLLERRGLEFQNDCPHPADAVVSRQAGMGGDWGYWTEHTCALCGKNWSTDHWA